MNEMKIEKGIPIPKALAGSKGSSKYSFVKDMEIGDSFIIPVPKISAYAIATRLGREFKIKLTVRTNDGICRVWRIA